MIKIALPKGRIEEAFYDTLQKSKIIKSSIDYGRNYIIDINDEYRLLLTNSSDVVPLLEEECADVGLIGSDRFEELNNENLIELYDLKTGICRFALATLSNISISDIKTIATKYPNIARKILSELKLNCEIRKLNGSLEIAPNIGYSDGIIDLVQTGSTLKANNLVIVKEFKPISTRIITIEKNKNNKEIKRFIKKLERR